MADTDPPDRERPEEHAREGRTPSLLVVSRSMPPDTGGYQRQLTLLAPHLQGHFRTIRWIGAVRDQPLSDSSPIRGVDHLLRVPAHRLARPLRGVADLVVIGLALLMLIGTRLIGHPSRVLLLSPTMVGAPSLVRAARLLGSPVIARYPTTGDAVDFRGRRVGQAVGATAVAPSPAQVNEQSEFPMRLLPNAVELVPISSALPSSAAGTFVYVGRLVARKRLDLLIDAWRSAARDLPGWDLVVVGDGGSERDSVEDELRRLASNGELLRCRLVGRVPDARPFLEAADVFVFPSDREGLPNSVLEAMATGVPVLAHPDRAREWFRVPPPLLDWTGAPDDLAPAMIRAASSPSRRLEVGRAGRTFVEEHHSAPLVAASLAALA